MSKKLITTELVDQIHSYLKGYNWEKTDIISHLNAFKATHGLKKFKCLIAFIDEAVKDNLDKESIRVTLGHDLNGCTDKLMLPRTYSYMKNKI